MASLDLQCISVLSIVGDCILRQEHWQAFGYRKRPKRGKLFDAFVNTDKLKQERVLVREFWAAAFGMVFYWTLTNDKFKHRNAFIARVMNLCIDGIDQEPLWPTFEFQSANDALDFLSQACLDYGGCGEHSEFTEVFLRRCSEFLDKNLPTEWIAGAAWLFNSRDSLFMTIIPALTDTVGRNPHSDIDLTDSRYFRVTEDLFLQRDNYT